MSDAILRALFRSFKQTNDPDDAMQFMHHYMRILGEVPQATAKQISVDEWSRLAQKQAWGEPDTIVNDVLQVEEPFDFGYRCPCGSVFLDSRIEDLTGFDDSDSFGEYCEGCRKIYGCGQCNLLINSFDSSGFHFALCQECFLDKVIGALQSGYFNPDIPRH
jgi:hypothetical protein